MKFGLNNKQKSEYWLTRFVILRFLGIVYLFAFLSLAFQVTPLVGENGLLPALSVSTQGLKEYIKANGWEN